MTVLNILGAVLTAGMPLFLLTYGLVSWSLYRGWLAGKTVGELKGSIHAFGKAQKGKESNQKIDPAMGKWFRFGGGFYGLVALYTWILIEWDDLADLLSDLGMIVFNVDLGALIRLVIEVFIESLVNFILAISWPVYWLAESHNPFLLLFTAYAGYWLGIKAAQNSWDRGWTGSTLDRAKSLILRGNHRDG